LGSCLVITLGEFIPRIPGKTGKSLDRKKAA
jgi:hypothetical protein